MANRDSRRSGVEPLYFPALRRTLLLALLLHDFLHALAQLRLLFGRHEGEQRIGGQSARRLARACGRYRLRHARRCRFVRILRFEQCDDLGRIRFLCDLQRGFAVGAIGGGIDTAAVEKEFDRQRC